jgi:hypothetical protein
MIDLLGAKKLMESMRAEREAYRADREQWSRDIERRVSALEQAQARNGELMSRIFDLVESQSQALDLLAESIEQIRVAVTGQ